MIECLDGVVHREDHQQDIGVGQAKIERDIGADEIHRHVPKPHLHPHRVDHTRGPKQHPKGESAQDFIDPIGEDQADHHQPRGHAFGPMGKDIGDGVTDQYVNQGDDGGGQERTPQNDQIQRVERPVRVEEKAVKIIQRVVIRIRADLIGGQVEAEGIIQHRQLRQGDEHHHPKRHGNGDKQRSTQAMPIGQRAVGLCQMFHASLAI